MVCWITRRRAAVGCLVALFAGISPITTPVPIAAAAIIVVTTTLDDVTTNGLCSLREALQAARRRAAVDACPAGADEATIVLPAGTYTLDRAGADEDAGLTGDLDIAGSVTLQGAGAETTIIDGNRLDRVLDVLSGSTLRLSRITIRNGYGEGDGGGIRNAGTLIVEYSTIAGNFVDSDDDYSSFPGGGGLANSGTATLYSSTLAANSAINGGAIYNAGVLHLTGITARDNRAGGWSGDGGGIFNDRSGVAIVVQSVLADNDASSRGQSRGGGILNAGTLVAVTSLIMGNRTAGGTDGSGLGGGLYNQPTGNLALVRTTVSSNIAARGVYYSGAGGGIYNRGNLTIDNSTISANRATAWDLYVEDEGGLGGGLAQREGMTRIHQSTITGNFREPAPDTAGGGAGIRVEAGTVRLGNTILAGNVTVARDPSECAGQIDSEGFNLFGSTNGCTVTGNVAFDTVRSAAGLGPLQENGGPAPTHALLIGSPAIDAADPALCPPIDQRGFQRPEDGNGDGTFRCDIGAYERQTLILDIQMFLPVLLHGTPE
jgi:CSLREA domain-containing protein